MLLQTSQGADFKELCENLKCLLFPSFANEESDVVGVHDLPKSPDCHNAFLRIAFRRFWLSAKGSLHKTTLLLIPVLRATEH